MNNVHRSRAVRLPRLPPLSIHMRSALIILLLLSIVAATAWTLWRWNDGRTANADPWRAVPTEAAVIIELPHAWTTWDRSTHTSLLLSGWEKQGAQGLSDLMAHMVSAMEKDATLRNAIGTGTVLIALMRNGSKGTGFVAVGALGDSMSPDALSDLLGISASERSALASGAVVSAAPLATTTYACAVLDGTWILGSSRELVDEALAQLKHGEEIMSDALFAKAYATLGKGSDAHVLLNTARLSGLLSNAWKLEQLERYALPNGWLALDLSVRPDAMLFSGLLVAEGVDPLITTIHQQGNGPWNIGRVLPTRVVQWEVHHVSEAQDFLSAVSPTDEQGLSLEALPSWAHGAVGTAVACDSIGRPAQRWLVISTDDPESAREALEQQCATAACDSFVHRGTRVSRSAEAHAWDRLMGRNTLLPQQPWWAILGNNVVMSDDADAVRASIDTWNDGNSLAEDERTGNCFMRMSDDAAFTWWCDPVRGGALFREGLKTGTDSAFAAWLPVLADLGGLSVQFATAQNAMVHVSMLLLRAPSGTSTTTAAKNDSELWSCTMQAPVLRDPEIVINHMNNTREVFVQDTLDTIHLISATGELLWSRALDGPILGAVHQVDRFKNGKLQLLFNTASAVHMIDRNGKDVPGFPQVLRAPAAAPLAVYDYDNERDYRVLVPLEDGTVINLTIEGAAVEGWVTPKLSAPAIAPVHHLRIRNKDHLLTVDRNGGIKLFDRKGNAREAVRTTLPGIAHLNAVFRGNELMAQRIAWTSMEGQFHVTTLAGDDPQWRSQAGNTLLVDDIDHDGAVDLLTAKGDTVILSTGDRQQWDTDLGNAPDRAAAVHSTAMISCAFASTTIDQVWLLDAQGHVLSGWPKAGSTPPVVTDVNGDGSFEAITITRDHRVIAYRTAAGP